MMNESFLKWSPGYVKFINGALYRYSIHMNKQTSNNVNFANTTPCVKSGDEVKLITRACKQSSNQEAAQS